MKNINKLILIIGLNSFILTLYGQESSSFNFGYNMLKNKPTFDLAFNRQAASDAEDNYEIKLLKNAFVLNPAAEAHWGSGANNSSDNIILHLNSYYKNVFNKNESQYWTKLYRLNILSPQFSCDKDFNTYQVYSTVGYNFISYYKRCDKLGYLEYNIGLDFDAGVSKIDSISGSVGVVRTKFYPSFQWQFMGKKSKDKIPCELNKDFYYQGELAISYNQYYFFKQDNRIVNDDLLGYLTVKASYRFIKQLKLSLIYKYGNAEPLYKKVNSLSIGLALLN